MGWVKLNPKPCLEPLNLALISPDFFLQDGCVWRDVGVDPAFPLTEPWALNQPQLFIHTGSQGRGFGVNAFFRLNILGLMF